MRNTFAIFSFLMLFGCKRPIASVPDIAIPEKLDDGTTVVFSKQGGGFELTILPINHNTSWEGNQKASRSSIIELLIDGELRIQTSKKEVIRVQGLSATRHSIAEYIDGERVSSFVIDGSTLPRIVADYHEMYGNWMTRDPQ